MPGSTPPYDSQTTPPRPLPRWGWRSLFKLAIQLALPLICIVALGTILLGSFFISRLSHPLPGVYICSACSTPMLESVSMVSASDGWAVGDAGGKGVIVHYQGGQWMQVNAPTDTPRLFSVFMLSASDGWAVGERGTILRYSGGQWQKVASPTSTFLSSVYMLSATEGWAVGPYDVLHYSGGVWTDSQPISELTSVAMVSANEGWAVGNETIAHYHNGAWTDLKPSTFSLLGMRLISVVMVSPREGWAIGNRSEGEPVFLHYQNGQWQFIANPLASDVSLTALGMVSPDEGWMMGNEGSASVILHYTRKSGWVPVATPLKIVFSSISMISPTDGWAVGAQNNFVHYEDGAWC